MVTDVLVGKLIVAEGLYGEEGVAAKCGMKARMYQLVKTGQYRLSRRALGNIVRSFPGLAPDVIAYLSADTDPDTREAAAA